MSFGDEALEPIATAVPAVALTHRERRLLAQRQWTLDQLIELAFLARRLADRIDHAIRSRNTTTDTEGEPP